MDNKKNGIPKLRFPGFTGAWEQRKLGDYYEFKNGLNKGKEFFGDGTPIVNFTDVFHNRGLISLDLDGRVQLTPKEIRNYEVKKGDLFFTRTSETIEEIGYPSVMLDNPVNTVFSGFVLRGRCVTREDPLENIFKKYVFFTDAFRQEMMKKSSMTTRALTSGISLKNMVFRFPISRMEQHKIGELLTKLDSLIALHQRKLEHLQEQKKGLLQKMFPKNGETVPEVRFPGFTDAWEQRKITELGKIYIGLVTTMTEHYVNKGTLLIRNSDIKEGKFEFGENPIFLDESFSEKNKSRMHQIGDVITVHTGDIGTSAVITEREANSIGFATIVTRPKKEVISSQYLCTFLNTEQHKKWALSVSTGDGRNNYNLKDYYRLRVPTPSIEEQQCISDFVGNLDTLITLHQRKLDHLELMKKGLLQQMFV